MGVGGGGSTMILDVLDMEYGLMPQTIPSYDYRKTIYSQGRIYTEKILES